MATPGQLVTATAAAFQLSEGTVRLFDRELAAAGLRSKGGRGPSAAQITPLDVANLVMALAGGGTGETVRDAVERVPRLAAMPFLVASSSEEVWERKSLGLPALTELPPQHTFGAILVALISSLWAGALDEPAPPDAEGVRQANWGGWISFDRPESRAIFTLIPPPKRRRTASLQNHYGFRLEASAPVGLSSSTTVYLRALRALTRRLGAYREAPRDE